MGLKALCLRIFNVTLNANFVHYNMEIGFNMNHLSQNTPPFQSLCPHSLGLSALGIRAAILLISSN